MATVLRYAGIALALLLLAVVFMACGESVCGVCAHACCVNSDRADRSRRVLGRILEACRTGLRSLFGDTALRMRWADVAVGTFALASPQVGGGLPLRI